MRQSIIFLFLLVSSLSSFAQSEIRGKYQGEVDLGYSFGTGNFSTNRINIHTTHGVRLGDIIFIGAGTGVDYYHDDSSELMLPIFANAKGYIPVGSSVETYLSANLGYGLGLTEGVKGIGGMLWSISAGVKIQKFKVQVGYTSQRLTESGIGVDLNAIQLGIGIVF